MSSPIASVRLSVLDRSRIREGHDGPSALRETVRLAQEVEAFGYHRFWVSEHHGVPGVAGSAPTVLAAAVAAATSTIRVGTGGVMLPNHQPLVVAEQFGVLESLYPGRVDMGLGRSVGFTDGVRRALGRDRKDADGFAEQLDELLGYFDGSGGRPSDGSGTGGQRPGPQVHARPAEGLRVPPYVLATGEGASIAARAGLPLVIGDMRHRERMLSAVDLYRSGFRPSRWAQQPYVIVSGTVVVARTEQEARRLLGPEAWSAAYSRTHGSFPALAAPERIESMTMTARERSHYEAGLEGHIAGTGAQVADALSAVIRDSAADEVLVTTSTYDREALLDSFRRLARVAGLSSPARA
ncbi:LLM class flavin-dependent oxidoreductase [Streptomyces sp. NPDC058572]|uniref:LLM class flavin-dependent oxidoreductase n=1 Tax=Streptomyces sp. NPDC058572 TaxID=3346546 RepID=UPI00364D97C0